jgi:hypothetical protein
VARFFSWLGRLIDPPVFVVEFEDGAARASKGSPSPGFLSDCSDVAKTFEIRSGRIYAHRNGAALQLRFSPEIPEESHQRFRNVLGFHGNRIKA